MISTTHIPRESVALFIQVIWHKKWNGPGGEWGSSLQVREAVNTAFTRSVLHGFPQIYSSVQSSRDNRSYNSVDASLGWLVGPLTSTTVAKPWKEEIKKGWMPKGENQTLSPKGFSCPLGATSPQGTDWNWSDQLLVTLRSLHYVCQACHHSYLAKKNRYYTHDLI